MLQLVSAEDESSTTPTLRNAPLLRPCETRVLGGRYRVRRLLGRGGMAEVFLGDDLLLERAVAIKILHPGLAEDSSGLERFRREAMTLAAVRSPHVVGIYDIGLAIEGVYLVMQYIDGHTIEQEIVRTGPMPHTRVTVVLRQLLAGLAEVHAQGLIHRDIKPSNVLLDRNGHVVLLDLGIAFDPRRAPLTAPGMIAGTPGYMAPESRTRAENEYTSDVYQVGLLMLFLLTGIDVARQCPTGDFEELIQSLPPSLAEVAQRALAADPVERFPSAAVMKEALDGAHARSALEDRAKPVRARTAREHRRLATGSERAAKNDRPTVELEPSHAVTSMVDTSLLAVRGEKALPSRNLKTTALQAAQVLSARLAAHSGTARPILPTAGLQKAPARNRILIVDDDSVFCATLVRMLTPSYELVVADTTTKALAQLASETRVDVILCGLAAPIEFYRAVQEASHEQADAIVFLMDGRSTNETRAFLARTRNKRLGKPFEIALLKQLIGECLASTRSK
jgi:serine/threonine protein kinase, bacterial